MATDPYTQLTTDVATLTQEIGALKSQVSAVIADLSAALATLQPGSSITADQVKVLETAIAALNASVAPFAPPAAAAP